jgi:hypothetical protein
LSEKATSPKEDDDDEDDTSFIEVDEPAASPDRRPSQSAPLPIISLPQAPVKDSPKASTSYLPPAGPRPNGTALRQDGPYPAAFAQNASFPQASTGAVEGFANTTPHYTDSFFPFADLGAFGTDFALDTNLGPVFGDHVLANLPNMIDSSFWEDLDTDWAVDPLDQYAPTKASPVNTAQPTESAYDRISRRWPKLGLVQGAAAPPANAGQTQTWTSAYSELRVGIELKPIEPPSTAFLTAAVHHFFKSFSPDQPFINEATFDPQARTPLLVLAICATGARWMASSLADTFVKQVFERLSLLLQVRRELSQ